MIGHSRLLTCSRNNRRSQCLSCLISRVRNHSGPARRLKRWKMVSNSQRTAKTSSIPSIASQTPAVNSLAMSSNSSPPGRSSRRLIRAQLPRPQRSPMRSSSWSRTASVSQSAEHPTKTRKSSTYRARTRMGLSTLPCRFNSHSSRRR